MEPARYRLKDKHYINVPGTEWEQRELNTTTKKQVRKVYEVPAYLDPDAQSDWNYPGVIIVASEVNEMYPNDIIFLGDPTPDMEPLNPAAKERVRQVKDKWVHPINTLSGTYGEGMLADLQRMLATRQQETGAKPNVLVDQLTKQVEALQAQVGMLTSLLKDRVNPGPAIESGGTSELEAQPLPLPPRGAAAVAGASRRI